MKDELFSNKIYKDEIVSSLSPMEEDFAETPQHSYADCATINFYQINYAGLTFYILCLVVFMITVTCLLKGRRARILKPPAQVIYHLCKTSYREDHFRLCKTLIEKEDYDVNYKDADGNFSLFLCACLSGSTELVSFMLKRGVNMNILSRDNDSAFYLACSSITTKITDFKILDLLLSAGSDINMQNVNGFTALHLACARGHGLLVEYLMKNGANPLVPTFNEVLPHQLALTNSHMNTAEYVLSKIDQKN